MEEKIKNFVSALRKAVSCPSNLDLENGIEVITLLHEIMSPNGPDIDPNTGGLK